MRIIPDSRGIFCASGIGLDTPGAVSLVLLEVNPAFEAVFVVRSGVIHLYPAVVTVMTALLKRAKKKGFAVLHCTITLRS